MKSERSDELVGDSQYYQMLGIHARQLYNEPYAAGYRESDRRWLNTPPHTELNEFVTEVSMSFGHPIAVLDLGCGTGRYFHCLRNLKSLTGVDVSPDMLHLARHPVQELNITIPVTLLCANLADVCFPNETFDLIYCIGVFGYYLPFDKYFMEKVGHMLREGGKFAFTTVDKNTPQVTSWKTKAAQTFLRVMPFRARRRVQVRLRSFYLYEEELQSILNDGPFSRYTIKRRYLPSGKIEFMCVTHKNGPSSHDQLEAHASCTVPKS